MKLDMNIVYLESSPSAQPAPVFGSTSSRYVTYTQPSAVISDSLDQIMKNHTLVRADDVSVDWSLSDSQVEA
jgi:hypothetical protein